MKRFIAAIAALCLVLQPAAAVATVKPSTPSFSIDDTQAVQGNDLVFTVRKHGKLNAKASTVAFATVAVSAKAGTDFRAVTVTLTFAAAETVKTVRVPTILKTWAEPTKTLTGKLTAGANARLYDGAAVGSILDASPTHYWCAGGVLQPIGQPCPGTTPPPPPATQTCPDGSVIPADQVCPVLPPPPPPPQWVGFPAGTAWNGLHLTYFARATKTCSSIYRTAETDRVGIAFRGVVAGEVYHLAEPGPATMSTVGAWGFTDAKNIAGQVGHHWTLAPLDQPGAWATVAQECLEGVKRSS